MGPTFGSDTDKPASEKNTRFKSIGDGVQHFSPGKVSFGQTEQQTVGQSPVPNAPPTPQPMPSPVPPPMQPEAKKPEPKPQPAPQQPQQVEPQPPIQPAAPQEVVTPESFIAAIANHLASVGKNLYAPLKWSELGLAGMQMPPKWMGLNGYRSAFSKKINELINNKSKNLIKDLDQLFVLLFLIRDEIQFNLVSVPVYYELANVLVESIYKMVWWLREKVVNNEADKLSAYGLQIWATMVQLDTVLQGAPKPAKSFSPQQIPATQQVTPPQQQIQQPIQPQIIDKLKGHVGPTPLPPFPYRS